jgi:hypothetical protein
MDTKSMLPADVLGSTAHYGTIAEAATDVTDPVSVILPDFDEELRWGPCFWQSRDAVSLPARGDRCLVMFDNRRTPWIVAWWPF